jgi:hypothetical protein
VKIEDLDLDEQYQKARTGLSNYMKDSNELFLEELGVHPNEVSSVNEWVRVTFNGTGKRSYLMETNLGLFSPNGERLGYYCLHEDPDGVVIDDFLVFE